MRRLPEKPDGRTRVRVDARLVLASRLLEVLGLAWLLVPINVMAFSFLPKEKTTSGSGLLNLARNFGTSCCISLAATLLARRAQFHQNVLVAHLTPAWKRLTKDRPQ